MYILAASVKRKRVAVGLKFPRNFPRFYFPHGLAEKFHTSKYHHFDYCVIVMKRQFFKTWCFNFINTLYCLLQIHVHVLYVVNYLEVLRPCKNFIS